MRITSPAFSNNQTIPVQYTCAGPNVSPPLEFADLPEGTQSLALTVMDVDSPNNWVHWLVFNIPPSTTSTPANTIPPGGTEGIANGGTFGYEGPCMMYFRGPHRYDFTLYALDAVLDVPSASNRDVVLAAMQGHVLAEAHLVGIQEGDGSAL
jgi:Raf kinase inhibitor-like YbhB/YbcL family protein